MAATLTSETRKLQLAKAALHRPPARPPALVGSLSLIIIISLSDFALASRDRYTEKAPRLTLTHTNQALSSRAITLSNTRPLPALTIGHTSPAAAANQKVARSVGRDYRPAGQPASDP